MRLYLWCRGNGHFQIERATESFFREVLFPICSNGHHAVVNNDITVCNHRRDPSGQDLNGPFFKGDCDHPELSAGAFVLINGEFWTIFEHLGFTGWPLRKMAGRPWASPWSIAFRLFHGFWARWTRLTALCRLHLLFWIGSFTQWWFCHLDRGAHPFRWDASAFSWALARTLSWHWKSINN